MLATLDSLGDARTAPLLAEKESDPPGDLIAMNRAFLLDHGPDDRGEPLRANFMRFEPRRNLACGERIGDVPRGGGACRPWLASRSN